MEIFSFHIVSLLGFVLALLLAGRLMREQRPPGSTMAWLLAIFLMPYLGVPLYLLIGGRKVRRLAGAKGPLYPTSQAPPPGGYRNDVERILGVCGAPPAREGNLVRQLNTGTDAYRALLELIEGAEHSIHVTTFILGRDAVGRSLVQALARRAEEGIQVRLLLDALGSMYTKGRFVEPLRRAGGRVGVFMPMLPLRRRWSANLRNHRKIVLVDGRRALVGGMNLAGEYMGPHEDPKRWVDHGLVLDGPVVTDIARVFSGDWYFATGEDVPPVAVPPAAGTALVQAAASGPDVATDPIYQALVAAFSKAARRIWIVTPYFIPDDVITRSLELQARLGCDVRVLVPARSNHPLADLVRGSYVRQLRAAGVRFFAFAPGMVHAKLLVVDDTLASAGSANLDIRSLYLNYEAAFFLHSPEEVRVVAAHVAGMLSNCRPLEERGRSRRTGVVEWVEDASRILAPLL